MSDAAADSEDASLWKAELRSLVNGANLVVLIAAVVVGVWGSFDSMTDADGDRFWGNFTVAAPGIYAGWCMLRVAWARLANIGTVLLRLVSSCFAAPAFVALPLAIIQAIAVAFPGVRQTIADAEAANNGFHYWWSEGWASQLTLVPLGGYALGMCAALGVALIITLPVISIRAPQIAGAGSHLEQIETGKRDSTTAFVFCGLGATVLGTSLWIFGDGESIAEFPEDLGRLMSAVSYGYFYWEDAVWLSGVVFVVVGVALLGGGCIRVLIARGASARG